MKLLIILLAALCISCVSTPKPVAQDIPPEIIKWAEKHVWKVKVGRATGSGFFISNKTFITACHVVKGNETAVILNDRSLRLFVATIESCDEETDIAVLTRSEQDERDFIIEGFTQVFTGGPARGYELYGAGHPMGLPMVITHGHYQFRVFDSKRKDNHMITVPTIPGDSGSPVIGMMYGRVVVFGIRVAVRVLPTGFTTYQLVPHLTLMSSGLNIMKAIHSNWEKAHP